jgi:hypothetical protein
MLRLILPLGLTPFADACHGAAGSRLGKFRAHRSQATQTVSTRTTIRATATIQTATTAPLAGGCATGCATR